jgi:BolA protein
MSRKQRIHDVLSESLSPQQLLIEDESSQHRRPGVETHFKVVAVSEQFESLTLLARHRLVNTCLNQEFQNGLHALSLNLYTPSEWERRASVPKTPPCHHK